MLWPQAGVKAERKQNAGEIHEIRKELLVLLYCNCQNCGSLGLSAGVGD